MDFYQLWKETRKSNISEESFIKDFLNSSQPSLEVLYKGTTEELLVMINVLMSTKIEAFLESIFEYHHDLKFTSSDVVQFSNFNHGVFDVTKSIKIAGRPLTYCEIGKYLTNNQKHGACVKYGENHSKLASEFTLVSFYRNGKITLVKNTSFGEVSLALDKDVLIELIRKLALRNKFIKLILSNCLFDTVDYFRITQPYISFKTALRRKSNVKFILSLILNGSNYEYLLKNIVW